MRKATTGPHHVSHHVVQEIGEEVLPVDLDTRLDNSSNRSMHCPSVGGSGNILKSVKLFPSYYKSSQQ